MKILYDLSASQPQGAMKINGGGGYAVILFRKTVEMAGADRVEAVFNAQNPDNEEMAAFCREQSIPVHHFDSIEAFGRLIDRKRFSTLVLPVCYPEYHGLQVDPSVRIFSVIHDLCHIYAGKLNIKYGEYPKSDGLNWLRKIRNSLRAKRDRRNFLAWHNKVIRLNDNQTVVTVTYYSKCAMLHHLNFRSPDDVKVFYSPFKRFCADVEGGDAILQKYGLQEGKYFMLSSTCRNTKNNAIAMFVLDRMFSDPKYTEMLKDYKVIALGTDELFLRYFDRKLRNRDRFVFENYVEMNALSALYHGAHLFLFPSLLEGFGLPPLEAMQCGTVPACSTAMSIPEVCGDAAIFFDPRDEESISLAVLKSFDSDLMATLQAAGEKRSRALLERGDRDLADLVRLIVAD
ncbi:MAG: glycosyltransferase [Clostridia bacterium]|nr:glycosyltransferase [Clostridia bacterium]